MAFRWLLEVHVDAPDLARVTSTAQIDYEDSAGAELPTVQTSVYSTVQAPLFTPVLIVDRGVVERGDEVRATAYYNNTGSVSAPAAWLNWTLAGHFDVVDLSPDLEYAETPQGIGLALTSVAPGPHSVVVTLRTVSGMADGLDVSIVVTWEAVDGNGNSLPTATLPSTILLNAPDVGINLDASATRLEVGEALLLNLTMDNSGKASATGWLNLTLPDGFEYLGTESGAYDATVENGLVSWAISTLPPETDVVLGVRLQLVGDHGLTALRFSLTFSDGKGSQPRTINSNTVFVEPVPVGPDVGSLLLWPLIAAVLLTAGFLVVRRWMQAKGLSVEEVFVIHRDGLLLAHRSKTLTPDKDQDVLVAMFKTVQDFIHDAFSRREDAPVRSLTFGEFNVLIEQGTNHHVAVIYRGEDNGALETQLSLLSKRIEDEFGEALDSWSGDMDEVRGLQDLLPMLWGVRAGERGEPHEGEVDRVKKTIQGAWDRLREAFFGVRDRLNDSPPVDEREVETRADGGWE